MVYKLKMWRLQNHLRTEEEIAKNVSAQTVLCKRHPKYNRLQLFSFLRHNRCDLVFTTTGVKMQ